MKKTLVIGSTVVDIILELPHLPVRSEDINVQKQSMQVGGCAYNVATLLYQLGMPCTLFSPIGSGIFGDFIRSHVKPYTMDIPLMDIEEENGACYCLIEADGERTFLSHHGAEYRFKKEWFSLLDNTHFDSVYLCGLEVEEESGEHILTYLEQHPFPVLYFAPGPRIKHIDEDRLHRLFKLSPILHLNEQEASIYTKTTSLTDMANVLFALTQNTIIITLGANGTYIYDGYHGFHVDGEAVDVGTTLGAGDAHIASIIVARKQGKSWYDAALMANHIAAQVTTCEGSTLRMEQVEKILTKI